MWENPLRYKIITKRSTRTPQKHNRWSSLQSDGTSKTVNTTLNKAHTKPLSISFLLTWHWKMKSWIKTSRRLFNKSYIFHYIKKTLRHEWSASKPLSISWEWALMDWVQKCLFLIIIKPLHKKSLYYFFFFLSMHYDVEHQVNPLHAKLPTIFPIIIFSDTELPPWHDAKLL